MAVGSCAVGDESAYVIKHLHALVVLWLTSYRLLVIPTGSTTGKNGNPTIMSNEPHLAKHSCAMQHHRKAVGVKLKLKLRSAHMVAGSGSSRFGGRSVRNVELDNLLRCGRDP